MTVHELAPGLWRWTVPHPDWSPDEGGEEGWDPEVGCVYCETGDGVVLIDPLVPDDAGEAERFWRALDRDLGRAGGPPSVLLTVYWHARSAREVAARHPGSRVFAAAAAREEMEARTTVTDWFSPGDELPGGISASPMPYRSEVVYWLPAHAALVPGDMLLGDRSGGLRVVPESWLEDGVTSEDVRAALLPLLDLPVERVLVSHGEPVLEDARAALARALGA